MTTTLDQQPLRATDDKNPGLIPGAITSNLLADTVTNPTTETDPQREPTTDTSLGTEHNTDIGANITPAVAAFLGLATAGPLIVGATGWADVSPFPVIAVGVFGFFAALFARVRFGGGKHTPLVGLLLLPVLAISATAAPHLDDGVGDRGYHPTSFDDVRADYQFGIGNLDIDLRDVEFPPGEHVITIEHGIGYAHVQLPADVSYSTNGEVSIGKLSVGGQDDSGFNTTIDAETDVSSDTKIVLEFDTSIGYGSVETD